jgi:hypothetical protein
VFYAFSNREKSEPKYTKWIPPPQPTREERITQQFSPWDGSHKGVTKKIKSLMNDPDSYKHVETRYQDKGEYVIVLTTIRGKNAFGAVMKNSYLAKVDLNGNVIEISNVTE